MPRDLTDLLAEALPRDAGAPDLGAIESRVARRRVGRLGAAVLAMAAAVAVGVQALPIGPPAPMIDQVEDTAPAGTTLLRLPPAGEVAAAHANGRPVFVVHDDDGDVRVLDAISPHDSDPQALKVLAYCTRSGWFEDLWHGSKFAGNGAWVGGPAPYGLAEHTVVARARMTGTGVTTERVTVGAMAAAPTRGSLDGEEPTGESCIDVSGDNEAPNALVVHDPSAEGAVPGLLYPEVLEGELVVPDEPQVSVAGPDVTLPLPAPGEVNADHVNGRPVFVLNHDDGNVLVLDAVNPHVTEFGPKVLAWCLRGPEPPNTGELPASGVAVDLWYGSSFAGRGMAFGIGAGGVGPGGWSGGPAPTGLGRLPVRTVTPETVTIGGSPLPAPPRVGDDSIGSEGCSEAVSLFPDAPPADATILDDLVLHEPLFEDDWWYPTPARILGEEPGLPPDELERYRELHGLDDGAPTALEPSAELVALRDAPALDLLSLPPMGPDGVAIATGTGTAFVRTDGTVVGHLAGWEPGALPWQWLDPNRPRSEFDVVPLVPLEGGQAVWLDPASGTTLPGSLVPLAGGGAILLDDDEVLMVLPGAESGEIGAVSALRPWSVSADGRGLTGDICADLGAPPAGCETSVLTAADVFAASSAVADPGCVLAHGILDDGVMACRDRDTGTSWVEVRRDDGGMTRIDMPRYPNQPAGTRTIGHITDVRPGGPFLILQLSVECEVQIVVGVDPAGNRVELFGTPPEGGTPASGLVGVTIDDRPLVALPDDEICGSRLGLDAGIHVLGPDGPAKIAPNGAPADPERGIPVAAWRTGIDLDAVAATILAAAHLRPALGSPDTAEVTAIDPEDRTVTFTPVRFVGGAVADVAEWLEGGDPRGASNDYAQLPFDEASTTLPLAAGVTISGPPIDGVDSVELTAQEAAAVLAERGSLTYTVTVDSRGLVAELRWVYRP